MSGMVMTLAIIQNMVLDQLPEGVRRRTSVAVSTDPYMLRTKLEVQSDDGRRWTTHLEWLVYDDIKYSAKIPDKFLAHLCVSI